MSNTNQNSCNFLGCRWILILKHFVVMAHIELVIVGEQLLPVSSTRHTLNPVV